MINDNNIKNSIQKPINSLIKVAQFVRSQNTQPQQPVQAPITANPQPIQPQPIPQQSIPQQSIPQPIQPQPQPIPQQPQPIQPQPIPAQTNQGYAPQMGESVREQRPQTTYDEEPLNEQVDSSQNQNPVAQQESIPQQPQPQQNTQNAKPAQPKNNMEASKQDDEYKDMWRIGNSTYDFDISDIIQRHGGTPLDNEIGNIKPEFYPLKEDVENAKLIAEVTNEASKNRVLIMDTVSSVINEELDKFNAEKASAGKDPLLAAAEKFARSQNPNASFDANGNKVEKKKYSTYDHLDDIEKGVDNDISDIDDGPMEEISINEEQPIPQQPQPQPIPQQQSMQSQAPQPQPQYEDPQPIQQIQPQPIPQAPQPIQQPTQAQQDSAQNTQSQSNNSSQPSSNQVSAGELNVDAISQMIGSGSLIKRFESQQSSQ